MMSVFGEIPYVIGTVVEYGLALLVIAAPALSILLRREADNSSKRHLAR